MSGIDYTGKPFVFAFWAVRLDALSRQPSGMNLAKVFQSSRDHGLQPENIAAIANTWSSKLGWTWKTFTSTSRKTFTTTSTGTTTQDCSSFFNTRRNSTSFGRSPSCASLGQSRLVARESNLRHARMLKALRGFGV